MGGAEVQLYSLLTSVLDVVSYPYRFTPRKYRLVIPIRQKARWAPEPVLTLWRIEKSLILASHRIPFPQLYVVVTILTELSGC
jgi:hypothetical protein